MNDVAQDTSWLTTATDMLVDAVASHVTNLSNPKRMRHRGPFSDNKIGSLDKEERSFLVKTSAKRFCEALGSHLSIGMNSNSDLVKIEAKAELAQLDRVVFSYFNGTYIEEREAPMPGIPCLTGLFVIANSPK